MRNVCVVDMQPSGLLHFMRAVQRLQVLIAKLKGFGGAGDCVKLQKSYLVLYNAVRDCAHLLALMC